MKTKFNLKAAITAAFLGITAFITSISASAWTDHKNQGLANANYSDTNPPIGYALGVDSFAWRVNLYVSTNADGRINESTDVIGGSLALVGSVLCTTSGLTDHYGTTYIQTNYTDTKRGGSEFSSSGVTPGTLSYTLPTLKEF